MDFWTPFILIVIVIVVVAFVWGIMTGNATTRRISEMEEKLNDLENFNATQKVMDVDGKTGLAIDEKEKNICLIEYNNGNIALDTMPYNDVLASEISENGNTITRTSRSSQLGGALIGGLALGGVGAIIGGLSGKTVSSDNVQRIDLHLIVNRTNSPVHSINFLDDFGDDYAIKKSSAGYQEIMQETRHWHSLLQVIIHQADEDDKIKEREVAQKTLHSIEHKSVTDQIKELVALRDQEIISDEEFTILKEKLLSEET